ncbi:MAG TPA: HAD family phosphatase [Gammaproteobacteria bacterium]
MGFGSKEPAIIFDLGGVLIDWNPRYLYRKIFKDDEAGMEYFLKHICSPDWNVRQDAGRPFREATEELIAIYPEHKECIEAYFSRWPEMVADALWDTVAILKTLKDKGYSLHALSNWSAETFPLVSRRFEFLGWFETILLSGEERLVKPEPRIFELMLKRIGRKAEQCIFIDDARANIAAAQELGFCAIPFTSPDQLNAELSRMGLI